LICSLCLLYCIVLYCYALYIAVSLDIYLVVSYCVLSIVCVICLLQADRLKETVAMQMTQTASGRDQVEQANRVKAAAERQR
jgi:hypothetical protein